MPLRQIKNKYSPVNKLQPEIFCSSKQVILNGYRAASIVLIRGTVHVKTNMALANRSKNAVATVKRSLKSHRY